MDEETITLPRKSLSHLLAELFRLRDGMKFKQSYIHADVAINQEISRQQLMQTNEAYVDRSGSLEPTTHRTK